MSSKPPPCPHVTVRRYGDPSGKGLRYHCADCDVFWHDGTQRENVLPVYEIRLAARGDNSTIRRNGVEMGFMEDFEDFQVTATVGQATSVRITERAIVETYEEP